MASAGHSSAPLGEKPSKHQKRRARHEESVKKSEDIEDYKGDKSIDELVNFINGSGSAKASKKGVKESNRDAGIKASSKGKKGSKPSQKKDPKPETAQ